ncbi:hypothetical protein AB1Y20_010425 [Prymnesium parvum]|uniref:Glycosyl hydrolase family 13 catalytic domain-containing protein n=1 Tax=Prymnesium parvum TaxID=97485 RepID=A0AB34IS48_PRYPA
MVASTGGWRCAAACSLLLLPLLAASSPPPPPPAFSLAGKSVYFVFVDRFAREGGGDARECSGHDRWCGGSLRGVAEQLDYVAGMGFDCLWITPVVRQPEGTICELGSDYCSVGYHGYWSEDFYAIDPRFGTAADLLALSRALKARGMCLVLDVVANHVRPILQESDVAKVHPFDRFDDYHTYGAAEGESFASYLTHPRMSFPPAGCNVGDFGCVASGVRYDSRAVTDGWFYHLADLNQEQPRVKAALLRWIRHIVETYGVDAIRLDTAPYMRQSFLKDFRLAAGVEIFGEVTSGNQTFLESFLRDPADGRASLDGLFDFRMLGGLFMGFCGSSAAASAASGTLSREGSDADLRKLAEAVAFKQSHHTAARGVSPDHFANFVDSHDEMRVFSRCAGNAAAALSAIAATMLVRGVPVVFYGTEQGFTESGEDDRRASLWQTRYDRTTPAYRLIAALNRLRRREAIATAPMRVHAADRATIVLSRGTGRRGGGGVWLFASNGVGLGRGAPVRYCPPQLPAAPPEGWAWVDELSARAAEFADGCVVAPDEMPLVLALARWPAAAAEEEPAAPRLAASALRYVYVADTANATAGALLGTPPPAQLPFRRFLEEFVAAGTPPAAAAPRPWEWEIVDQEAFFASTLDSLPAGAVVVFDSPSALRWRRGGAQYYRIDAQRAADWSLSLPRLWRLLNHSAPLLVVLHADGGCDVRWPRGSHHLLYRDTWSDALHDEWRASRHAERLAGASAAWLRALPFGTGFDHGELRRLAASRRPAAERTLLFSFRGSLAFRKPSREALLLAAADPALRRALDALATRLLAHLPEHPSRVGRYLLEAKGEGAGVPWDAPYPSEGKISYLELLRASVFTLSPPGDLWEAYRTYEAIEAGSIPVVVANQTYKGCAHPAAHLLATVPGVVSVGSWQQLPAALEAAATNASARQAAMLEWLAAEKRAAYRGLVDAAERMREGRWRKQSSCRAVPLSPRQLSEQHKALARYWRGTQPFEDGPWEAGPYWSALSAKELGGGGGLCAAGSFEETCMTDGCNPPLIDRLTCE